MTYDVKSGGRLAAGRRWVQIAFLILWLDPLALRLHQICGPVFHCYACPLATFACPIGVMAQFSALHLFPFLAVGTVVAVGAIFGGFVCGWACPFGLLQDLAGKVGKAKIKLPYWTNHLRYAVLLVLVVVIPYFYGVDHPLFICSVCPAGGLEAATPHMVKQLLAGEPIRWPNAAKIAVVSIFLITIFLIYRPWCRLCPLGAIFGLFNRISALFVHFQPQACTSCGICYQHCGLSSNPTEMPDAAGCIRCLECTTCPERALEPTSLLLRDRDDSDRAHHKK